MKKGTVAGLALGGLLAAAGAAYLYCDYRVHAEIDRLFAELRAAGAKAAHGPVKIDVIKRRVEVFDIIVKPAGAAGDVTIARIAAEGVKVWARDFAANRLELTHLAAASMTGARDDRHLSLKIASAVAHDIEFAPHTAGGDTGAAKSEDSLLRAIAVFGALSATSVAAPNIDFTWSSASRSKSSTPQQGAAATVFGTLASITNIKLDTIERGRVGRASIDRMTWAPDQGTAVLTGTLGASVLENFDPLPAFGIGLEGRSAQDRQVQVLGRATLGTYAVKLFDGTEIAASGLVASGLSVDPQRATVPRLQQILSAMPHASPDAGAAPARAHLADAAIFAQGIRLDRFDVRNIRMRGAQRTPQAFNIEVGSLSASRLDQGRFADVRLDDLRGAASSAPLKLGALTLRGVDVVRLLKPETETAAQSVASSLLEPAFGLMSALDGFEVRDVTASDPRTGQPLQIDQLKADWSEVVGDLPTNIRLDVKGSAAMEAFEPGLTAPARDGVEPVALTMSFASSWDAATRAWKGTLSLQARELAVLSVDVALDNVPRSTFLARPGLFNAVVPEIAVGRLQLKLQDLGLIRQARAGLGSEALAEALADTLAPLKRALAGSGQPGLSVTPLFEAVDRFVAAPDSTLSINLAPRGRVTRARIMASDTEQSPSWAAALAAFSIDVTVAP